MRYLFLIVLTLAVTLPGIWTLPPLDRDESRYVQATRQMVDSGNYIDIRFQEESRYKKPVGIYWLQSAAAIASGKGGEAPIWIYRLVSVSGIVLAVAATYWTGAALFGPGAGLVAAMLLASMFGVAIEARIAKTDAMLLGAALLAQGAMAQIYAASRNGAASRRDLPWIFWAAQGVAILLKGPIVPLIGILTVGALWLFDRDVKWLKALRPGAGSLLAAVIALPWLVAISWTSGGAFWSEAVGNDMLGKVAGGQESHGAPPGYYVLTYALYVWPLGPLLLASGIAALGRMRDDPRLRFLLAWYVPCWLFFELVPTKLPHYLLPAYPALALLAGWAVAQAIDLPAERRAAWRKWLYRLAILGQAVVTLFLAALAVAGPQWLGDGISAAGIAAAAAVILAGWFGLSPARQGTLRGAASTALAAGLAYTLLLAFVVPSMERIWLTPRIAATFQATRPCPQSVLASVGYHEPSLVFMTGTRTRLTDTEGAARHLLADPKCAVALLPEVETGRLAELTTAAGPALVLLAEIEGINYSKGDTLKLKLFALTNHAD